MASDGFWFISCEQVGAHRDQRGGAAGRAIEPAEQLLAARLGGVVDLARRDLVVAGPEFRHGAQHPFAIGPEFVGKRAKKRRLIGTVERSVAVQNFAGDRHP